MRLNTLLSLPSQSRGLRGRLTGYFTLKLTKRTSFIFILIFTTITIIDSTAVKYFSYSGIEISTASNVQIFTLFSAVYAIFGMILLKSVVKNTSGRAYNLPINLKYFYAVILVTQICMICIIIAILLQMAVLHKYSILLLQGSTVLTHVSALVFSSSLFYIFLGWLKSKKNYIIILYCVAFALVSASIITSLIYLEFQFSLALRKDIRAYAIHFVVIQLSSSRWTEILSSLFDVLSLSSFLSIWLATVKLLSQYRYRVGRIRYFVLTSIPLIYYLVPFQDYFGNMFATLVLSSPIAFGVIYVLLFSATKQIGALLFSLAFWTASTLVYNERVRNSLLISAVGMALLFGSIEIGSLKYKIYPPYGLVTEAFMPLGSFLLYIGIFTSATSVSRDADLRKKFYKTAESQLSLLKTIGITQMENELLRKYKPALALSNELEKPEDEHLAPEDVKEIIRDVLNELQSRERDTIKGK